MVLFRVESRVTFRSQDVDVDVGMTLTFASGTRSRPRRRSRDALWTEMVAYSTESDRLEMEAILDRYTDDETDEIRSILSAQALNRPGAPPGGPSG